MSDGAGAVLLMKRSLAIQKGLPILGVFRYDIIVLLNNGQPLLELGKYVGL